MRRRKADHAWRLRANRHPCKRLQDQFNKNGGCEFLPIFFFRRFERETDEQFRERLRAVEQSFLDMQFSDPHNENQSPNAKGPDQNHFKRLWDDPEWRAWRIEEMKKRAVNVSESTRAKMSEAKKGGRNPKARAVLVKGPDGFQRRFDSTTAAAGFFKVSQQCFEQWIKGIVPWPGSGESVRKKNAWIADYSACFEDIL